jgi:SPP1 gp7 family putative phage head morphogenesis protein
MPKKTKSDPTGQAVNRNKSTRRLSVRLTRAEREVKALFRAVPRTRRTQTRIVNAEQIAVYDYDFDQAEFGRSVEFILNDELLETQTDVMPFGWYWKDDVELPYRQGTVEEVRDFNVLVTGAVAAGVLINGLPPQAVPVEQVLLSEPYRAALNNAQVSNFTTIKGLSERTTAQVLQRINAGIQAGDTPTLIANEISERFDVAKSSAKRIAETEINQAYTNAKLDATDILREQTGLRAGVIHISALSPTTRQTHADRHGNAYTTADQRQWWAITPNRINCKCNIRSVLIDRQGNVVQAELQADIKAEGREFFSD